MKLKINSWRWKGVPFYIRAGKSLPVTCTEILGRFRKPPTLIPEDVLTQNTLRLRISPDATIAMGMMLLSPSEKTLAQPVEMVCPKGAALGEPGFGAREHVGIDRAGPHPALLFRTQEAALLQHL